MAAAALPQQPAEPPGPAVSVVEEPTALFKKAWRNYEVLVRDNNLCHLELYAQLDAWLTQRVQALGRPLSMLELGCGDATHMTAVLAAERHEAGRQLLAGYTGVDLAQGALEVAKARMARTVGDACALAYHVGDMLRFVQQPPPGAGGYDVVLVSFSLHHLAREQKGEFLRAAHALLKERGGAVLLIDIVCRPGEAQPDYIKRIEEVVHRDWTGLDAEGKQMVMDHMSTFDFPEDMATYRALGRAAGFADVTPVYSTPRYDFFTFVAFQC